ncbi:hypothetical protein TRM7557_01393 [Tritonibacter multivorans]|uniref:Uncharacterized protein n=1 Tax=Tritonibacter multivorans TaxID=928856 RepID=A0A0P1G7C6_9RHOB|nr:hypothetical protein TRM7557_01393 [Tritonibacter multivorans]SFD32717.1 hypothetical protein SAMN04488049_11150 [Tritonibacter multivorans]
MLFDIWRSFRAMPLWVQIWVAFVLAPANIAALAFLDQPGAPLVGLLAIGGMIPNLPIIFYERGFSKLMALPHILIWTPLCVVILSQLSGGTSGAYATFLMALLVIDLMSLGFDYPDFVKWLRGDRAIAA